MKCEDCNQQMPLEVLRSNAGWYIGRWCHCGPYSRESEYFKTSDIAKKALASGNYIRREQP